MDCWYFGTWLFSWLIVVYYVVVWCGFVVWLVLVVVFG